MIIYMASMIKLSKIGEDLSIAMNIMRSSDSVCATRIDLLVFL